MDTRSARARKILPAGACFGLGRVTLRLERRRVNSGLSSFPTSGTGRCSMGAWRFDPSQVLEEAGREAPALGRAQGLRAARRGARRGQAAADSDAAMSGGEE